MDRGQVHFEVFVRKKPSSSWTLELATESRARALEEAGLRPAVISLCSGSALFGFPVAAGVPADEVAEFVRQRAVTRWQALLDQEDVMVAVLTPLAGDADRQLGHGYLDGTVPMLTDGGHQPAQRHLAVAGSQVQHVVHRLGDLTAG